MSIQFRADNHYLPEFYLNRWADADGRVWIFRTLVSDPRVPEWGQKTPKGVAYRTHLYTELLPEGESDEIERYFAAEIETPAQEVLAKVTSDQRLTPVDWRRLVLFLAAQDVRTPLRLVESMRRQEAEIPSMLKSSLQEVVDWHERKGEEGRLPPPSKQSGISIPLRVSIEKNPDGPGGHLKAETYSGRAIWLESMRHLLSRTVSVLQEQQWRILHSPPDFEWITSDNPVLKLNYYSSSSYDLKGGWGSRGTEIFLPLSPSHLMYTKVRDRSPRRGQVKLGLATSIQKLLAENSYRYIFALQPEPFVSEARPRMVDREMFRREAAEWKQWHQRQSEVEQEFVSTRNNP